MSCGERLRSHEEDLEGRRDQKEAEAQSDVKCRSDTCRDCILLPMDYVGHVFDRMKSGFNRLHTAGACGSLGKVASGALVESHDLILVLNRQNENYSWIMYKFIYNRHIFCPGFACLIRSCD